MYDATSLKTLLTTVFSKADVFQMFQTQTYIPSAIALLENSWSLTA